MTAPSLADTDSAPASPPTPHFSTNMASAENIIIQGHSDLSLKSLVDNDRASISGSVSIYDDKTQHNDDDEWQSVKWDGNNKVESQVGLERRGKRLEMVPTRPSSSNGMIESLGKSDTGDGPNWNAEVGAYLRS